MIFRKRGLITAVGYQSVMSGQQYLLHLKLIRKGHSLALPRICCCSVPQSCISVTPWTKAHSPVLHISVTPWTKAHSPCPSHLPEFAQIHVH